MIRYLDQYEDVILRENKRYYLNFPTLESLDSLELDQEIFVREASPVYQALLEQSFETELRNQINAAILVEKTDFARIKMTLSNYFYKVKQQYPLTEKQQ